MHNYEALTSFHASIISGVLSISDTNTAVAMLSGSTVTTTWLVVGLRIEETASRHGG
jgi:hypothetical protein